MKQIELIICMLFLMVFSTGVGAQEKFTENFEGDLSNWEVNATERVRIIDSEDPLHNHVMALIPDGKVWALIKDSDQWGSIRLEGEMLFPTKENSYLGFIYNYHKQKERSDFGVLYVKGNSSYIRANPWRDGNVSRLLYEEYRTNLNGDQGIEIGVWHKFKMEMVKEECHLYINDMTIPKITFGLFEFASGKAGFQPRVVGADVWIDNIRVTSIEAFTYKGAAIPDITYNSDTLLTDWEVIGPLKKPSIEVERSSGADNEKIMIGPEEHFWRTFEVDKRGAVITGRVTEYEGENTVAYFRTFIEVEEDTTVVVHFTTTDELVLYVNGRDYGRVYRDGYFFKDNDWNAWYDFWKNPKHAGRKQRINLKKGRNQIVIRVRNGQFASGGFFAFLEK